LKKLNMQQLPGIEQVNMFKEDNTIIHFQQPAV
jgi:nascent polypeptide-associated complex subunit beta